MRFAPVINKHERALLEDAEVVLQDLHALPNPVRVLIAELVQNMSRGMQQFALSNPPGVLRLKTLREVNQYCFYVAGLVGELLARLLARVEPTFAISEQTILRAHHFGLFLQKRICSKIKSRTKKKAAIFCLRVICSRAVPRPMLRKPLSFCFRSQQHSLSSADFAPGRCFWDLKL